MESPSHFRLWFYSFWYGIARKSGFSCISLGNEKESAELSDTAAAAATVTRNLRERVWPGMRYHAYPCTYCVIIEIRQVARARVSLIPSSRARLNNNT